MAKGQLWPGPQSIQWGCALMELLGESSLEFLPLVLSGNQSVELSLQVQAHKQAIQRARQLLGKVQTRRSIEWAVRNLQAMHRDQHLNAVSIKRFDLTYQIDPTTLRFQRLPGQGPRIAEARTHLIAGPVTTSRNSTVAPGGDLVAVLHPNTTPVKIPVRITGVDVGEVKQHDLTRKPDAHLMVNLQDLQDTARKLDQLDRESAGAWEAEGWEDRLTQVIHLQKSTETGLEDTQELSLQGLKHLIGLPGAGKTTLITLLCAHLAARGKRVCVFFTSIETAREYLERLQRYQVSTAMLVGSSTSTQRKHGERLAELIATRGDQGFGHTRTGAELFAQTCPLPAFAVEEAAAWAQWAPEDAPCEHLLVPGSDTHHLCPLFSRCGRVKNQRDLVAAQVWLGHVRSADTRLPAHTCQENLQYFELIARTFDLVVFDEVDETQKTLDELGSRSQDLVGSDQSVHAEAQKFTSLALKGHLKVQNPTLIYNYQYVANAFEAHMVHLHEEIRRFEKDHQQDLNLHFQNRLLTSHFMVNQAIEHLNIPMDDLRLNAIFAFWDSATSSAFFREERPWGLTEESAKAIGWTLEEARQHWKTLVRAMEHYLHHLNRSPDLRVEMQDIETHFANLIDPSKKPQLAPVARLAVTVGFAILAFQDLIRISRPLTPYGVLPEVVRTNASRALEQRVPKNLLGTFSSLRYQVKVDGDGFDITYVMLDSAPRLLLQRIHHLGANVLLTSATSWLPDSSMYHVQVRPDYVLRPKQQQDVQLRLRFQPIDHPGKREPLRFSGAGSHQLENLKLMVNQLARRNVGRSSLEKAALATATPLGRERMCALVVNSYDQVIEVVRQIAQVNPELAERTRGVVRRPPSGRGVHEHYVLRGQVETLAYEEELAVVVFPLAALGRGVNIVFKTEDKDNGTAAIGSVYFLTRPHPVVGDLGLMISNIAQHTEKFDQLDFRAVPLAEIQATHQDCRRHLYSSTMKLLSRSMSASQLPDEYLKPFAANLLIPILQTIGRAIRRSRPASVYFVDAAWAPRSASGETDTGRTSVLVTMQNILKTLVNHPDPEQRAIMSALYGPFAEAFSDIDGLKAGGPPAPEDRDDQYPPILMEDDGDLDEEHWQ